MYRPKPLHDVRLTSPICSVGRSSSSSSVSSVSSSSSSSGSGVSSGSGGGSGGGSSDGSIAVALLYPKVLMINVYDIE